MFAKLSRYRKVLDVTALDEQGRALATKDLRLLPEVTGTFRHTVNGGDRLDQLAYKYYSQPAKWWRICDANPQFLSPLALLDHEPVLTTRFPLGVFGGDLTWADVFRTLQDAVGVENVQAVEDVTFVPAEKTVEGQKVTVLVTIATRAVLIRHNRLNVTAETLAAKLAEAGFQVETSVEIGQLGREIVIPPDVIG